MKISVLFRNYFVFCISLLSPVIFANPPSRTSLGSDSSYFQPYWRSMEGPLGRVSVPRLPVLLPPLALPAAFRQAFSAPPLPPLAQILSVSTPAVSTPAVSAPAVSAPAVSTPAVSTPAVSTPAVSTPAVSAASQEKEALVFDNPNISEEDIKNTLQALDNFIARYPGEQFPLHLCNPNVLDKAVEFFRLYPGVLAFINGLELRNFKMNSTESISVLIDFLKNISPTLVNISFIDCEFSESVIKKLKSAVQNEGVLKNIVKLELTRTSMAFGTFSQLFQTAKLLKKLTHLSFDLNNKNHSNLPFAVEVTAGETIKNFSWKNNLKLKTLKFSGNLFKAGIMENFIFGMLEHSDYYQYLEKLDIAKTGLSPDKIKILLQTLFMQANFLRQLQELYLPSIEPGIDALQQQRPTLKISRAINEGQN